MHHPNLNLKMQHPEGVIGGCANPGWGRRCSSTYCAVIIDSALRAYALLLAKDMDTVLVAWRRSSAAASAAAVGPGLLRNSTWCDMGGDVALPLPALQLKQHTAST